MRGGRIPNASCPAPGEFHCAGLTARPSGSPPAPARGTLTTPPPGGGLTRAGRARVRFFGGADGRASVRARRGSVPAGRGFASLEGGAQPGRLAHSAQGRSILPDHPVRGQARAPPDHAAVGGM